HVEQALGRQSVGVQPDGRDKGGAVAGVGADERQIVAAYVVGTGETAVVEGAGLEDVAPGPDASVGAAGGALPFGLAGQARAAPRAVIGGFREGDGSDGHAGAEETLVRDGERR